MYVGNELRVIRMCWSTDFTNVGLSTVSLQVNRNFGKEERETKKVT